MNSELVNEMFGKPLCINMSVMQDYSTTVSFIDRGYPEGLLISLHMRMNKPWAPICFAFFPEFLTIIFQQHTHFVNMNEMLSESVSELGYVCKFQIQLKFEVFYTQIWIILQLALSIVVIVTVHTPHIFSILHSDFRNTTPPAT